MIKTIEAVMAIVILLGFILILFNNYSYSEYRENIIKNRTYDLLNLKAQDSNFRELIENDDSQAVYNALYNYISINFKVKICDFLDGDCISYSENEPSENSIIHSVNYYFYKNNKILYILIWAR